jgi:hypothetical protein
MTMTPDEVTSNQAIEEHSDHSFQAHPEHAEAIDQAIHAIQRLALEQDGFADMLRTAATTDEVREFLHNQGIEISSEALWRHRGVLLKDGHPTWRG